MDQKKVTIYDIAREAGVSPATVSRILTGAAGVREEKKRRVLEIIERVDFQPNAAARALTENRTRYIAMVVAHAENSYYNSIFAACENEAYKYGYVTMLMDTASLPENEVSVLKRIRELRPEAIILCGGRIDREEQDPAFTELLETIRKQTRIVVGSRSPLPGIPGIFVDHRASMRLGVQYLAGLGHREICFVYAGKENYGTVERLDEFDRAMREFGLAPGPDSLIEAADYSIAAGIRAAQVLVRMDRKPTAVLGMNDMVSAGLLQGLLSMGIRVPEDISLLGFDDTYVTRITTPNLTSVGYDYQAYGSMLVRTALEPAEPWPENRRIPVFIAERDSCAPLR